MNGRWIVALPAKNEKDRLAGAMAAINVAAGAAARPVHLLILANDCVDETSAVAVAEASHAARLSVVVVNMDMPAANAHAGGARAACVDAAFAAFGSNPADYLLTSDADARIAPDFFVRCEAAFSEKADVVLASIECEHDVLDPVADEALAWGTPQVLWRHRVRQLTETIRTGAIPCPPLHDDYGGAGIATTVAAYQRLGGFPVVASNEDKSFVYAADAAGLSVCRQSGAVVTVLARATGRATGGMACALAYNAQAVKQGIPCLVERHDLTEARLRAYPSHAHAFVDHVVDVEPVEDAIAGLDRLIAAYADPADCR